MKKFDEIPFPEYESDPSKIALLYADAWNLIIKQVYRLTQLPQTDNTVMMLNLQASILRQLTVVFDDLNRDVGVAIAPLIEDSYIEGLSYTKYALGLYESLTEARQGVSFSLYNKRRLDKQITDMQTDLLKVTNNTEENVKRLVRTSVATAMRSTGGRIIKKSNMEKRIQEELNKKMLEEKLSEAEVGLIDKGNNRWKMRTYVKMATKTKMNNSYMDGIRDEALEDGHDLGIISTKPGTSDACLDFEGMIISLNGLTPGYPSYQTLRQSKLVFHPNCGHFVRPVAGLQYVPKPHLEKSAEKMKKWEKYKQNDKIKERIGQV